MASRLTTNQEIAGSTPAVVITFFILSSLYARCNDLKVPLGSSAQCLDAAYVDIAMTQLLVERTLTLSRTRHGATRGSYALPASNVPLLLPPSPCLPTSVAACERHY